MKSSFWFRAAMIVALLLKSGPAFAAVTITTTSKTFAKEGGAASVSTGGTGSWTATTDVGWITFNRASGEAGVSCVYVVSANYSADTRSATIDIGGNDYTVTQTGYTATISPTSATVDYAGGNGAITVTVDAGVSWTARANCDWLSVSPDTGTSGGSVTYTVAPYNGGVTTRTGSITVAGRTFSVSQTGTDVAIVPDAVTRDYNAGVFEVEVAALSSTSWTVAPEATWISVVDSGYGYGNSTILVAVGENPSVAARTGTVRIGSKTLTVTQKGMINPTLAITPTEAEASPVGAYGNVAVYATPDATWTAESLSPWITISEGTSGAGNGNIKYVAAANPTLAERTGRIKVTPPAVEPEVDYLAGLVVWCPNRYGYDWASGRLQTTKSFYYRFNGTFENRLDGIPANCPAYGFEFRLWELGTIHRLSTCGNQTIWIDADDYLVTSTGGRTSFRVSETNVYYQVLVNGGDIWAGKKKAGSLVCIGGCETVPTDGFIRFGYTELPSPGYLSNAQVFGLAMWNRVLTDKEAALLGTSNFPLQDESYPGIEGLVPGIVPEGMDYSHFPLGGNALYATNGATGPFEFSDDVPDWQVTNAFVVADRFGLPNRAIEVNADARIESRGSFANRIAATNATYSFWIQFDSISSLSETNLLFTFTRASGLAGGEFRELNGTMHYYEGRRGYHRFYNRYWDGYFEVYRERPVDSPPPDFSCQLYTDPSGNLNVCYPNSDSFGNLQYSEEKELLSTVFSVLAPSLMDTMSWHMVTMVCKAGSGVTLFVDGNEVGNFSTSLSFGLFPETYKSDQWDILGQKGWILETRDYTKTLSIGGFQGKMDEMTIFHDALTSAQVRQLYEAGKPGVVYHTVTQGVIEPAVSPAEVSFGAAGGSTNVQVTVAANTQWTAESDASWITVTSSASSAGSARVSFDVAANSSTEARTGTLTLAGKAVTVSQSGLWSQISYDGTVFSETSDSGFIDVQVEGNGTWTASTDADWLTLLDDGGRGSGSVMFVVDDFNTTAASRTATVTIAGKTVFITQRGYQLSIDPAIAEIGSNAGAGEIGVSAPIGAVWEAIVSADWITLVGGSTGVGDGTLRYTVAENTTGATRTGKIVISGQEYTLTQLCTLKLETSADGNGTVSGAGDYDTNESATLVATPAAGYAFTHWSGDAVGVEPTVTFTMDTSKKVTAHFIPEDAARRLAEEKAAQGGFYTREQIHAMELGNVLFDVDPATGKARIGVKLMETSSLSNPDWKPVSVTTQDLDIGADGSVGISAPATGNAKFFRVVSESE